MQFTRVFHGISALAVAAGFLLPATASSQPVRIAVIEPLSGPTAGTGKPWVDNLTVAADELNARGGVLNGRKIQIVPLDNAGNVEKTNELLNKAYDDGIRYVAVGIGSNHALATTAFVERQNKRSPDNPMVFFNTSGGALALTNENCSYWHFRWGIGADMYASALVNAMAKEPSVKRIYQMDQGYALGQAFHDAAKQLVKERLPNASVVASDVILPFGKVQDFTPYVAKLRQLNVDTVLTSAFDVDFIRFYKAIVAAGLKVRVYAAYGNLSPHMAVITPQDLAIVPVVAVTDLNPNDGVSAEMKKVYANYRSNFNGSYFAERMVWMLDMFKSAIDKAGEDNPRKVAAALEQTRITTPSGPASFRTTDHQFEFPLTIVQLTASVPEKYFVEGRTTGVGFKTLYPASPQGSMMPTTCKMARPS